MTAKDIISKAILDAKTMRISMGSAVVNKLNVSRNDLNHIKNEALEKLNRLEKMINKKIDQGVTTLMERRSTIQENPFFKKKQPMQGLHDFKSTMQQTMDKTSLKAEGRIRDKVLTHRDLIKIGSMRRKRLTKERVKHRALTLNTQKPTPNHYGGKLRIPTEVSTSNNKVDKRVHSSNFMYYNPKSTVLRARSNVYSGKYGRKLKSMPRDKRIARFNEQFTTEQFRIKRKTKRMSKKMHQAKFIPRDIRKGNPFADLPVIRDEDLKDGIYNLVNQGFIPKEVDVEPILGRDEGILNIKQVEPNLLADEQNFSIVMAKNNSFLNFDASQLEDSQLQGVVTEANESIESSINSFTSKDQFNRHASSATNLQGKSSHYMTEPQDHFSVTQKTRNLLQSTTNSKGLNSFKQSRVNSKSNHMREAQSPETLIKHHLEKQTIEVERGKVKENTDEFMKFKSKTFYMWGDIQEVIDKILNLMKEYGISNIKLLTNKILKLASYMREPTRQEISSCIENYEMVMEYSKKRVKDDVKLASIKSKAATVIQKGFKAWAAARYLIRLLSTKARLRRIQSVIKIWYKYRKTKKVLRKIKEDMCNEYINMHEDFKENWHVIKNQRRVEVHLNSLGWDRFQKLTTGNYHSQQNSQLSRIFRLIDPNVEIIYVCPFDLPLEVLSYYVKILDILGIPNVSQRIHLITPESYDFFKNNNISTTNLLYYSPNTLRKVISIIGDSPAYIVGGYPNFDDIKLSLKIGAPFLTGNPFVNKKYLDVFECKRMLEKKRISVGEYSSLIESQSELVESLASLLVTYPSFDKWEFNIVDEFDGRGRALFRTDSLSIMNEIRLCDSYDERILHMDHLKDMIRRFLSSNLNIAASRLFRNYSEYKNSFMTCGGVIESLGHGENYVVGAQYFIHPDGYIEYMTSFEELMTPLGQVLGYICPQVHLPEKTITSLGQKVCKKIFEEGVMGYISIMIKMRVKSSSILKMTIKSIQPYFTAFLSAYQLFHTLTTAEQQIQTEIDRKLENTSNYSQDSEYSGHFKDRNLHFNPLNMINGKKSNKKCLIFPKVVFQPPRNLIELGENELQKREKRFRTKQTMNTSPDELDSEKRSNSSYLTFFDNCRKQGIYFDISKQNGSVFMLSDNLIKGELGCMFIDDSFRQCVKYAGKCVTYLGGLSTQNNPNGDSDAFEDQMKDNHDDGYRSRDGRNADINTQMVLDLLYRYQKKVEQF